MVETTIQEVLSPIQEDTYPSEGILAEPLFYYGRRNILVGSFESHITDNPNYYRFHFKPLFPVDILGNGFNSLLTNNYQYANPAIYSDGSVIFTQRQGKDTKHLIGVMAYIYAKLLALRKWESDALDRLDRERRDMIANSQGEGQEESLGNSPSGPSPENEEN